MLALSLLALGAVISLVVPASAQAQRAGGGAKLTAAAQAALLEALAGPDGEYAARATYAAILAKWNNAQPFANIYAAEVRHVEALVQQCKKYGVPVPADEFMGNVEAPADLCAAAEQGVAGEILNIAMYEGTPEPGDEPGLLEVVQQYPSLVLVFTNLRDASLYNHLPAFRAAVATYCPSQN